ncbi:MAG TPA: DUF3570 domain-containing protein [Kofleriaceae bacterium]|nr:DUF3570 domain-containing protein [Kofleriaceae bacterium]
MRLQLALARRAVAGAAVATALVMAAAAIAPVWADDQIDLTTTWYLERRRGPEGGLSVVHPQLDVQLDAGDSVTVGAGYTADVVSGATASVFSVDAVASATPFEDVRHEAHASLAIKGSRSGLSVGAGAAAERDYTSINVVVAGNVDLPGKNTNLALSYTHHFDHVCDRDNGMAGALERRALTGLQPCERSSLILVDDTPGETVWREVEIDTAEATLTQNLSPTLAVQAGAYGQILRGFQSNPYRRVAVSGVEPQESVPDVRGRLALFLQANKYLTGLHSAVHGAVRGYSDTWGVNSLALEMGYSQYFGDSLLFRLRGRVYQQTEASFFKDAFFYDTEGPAGAYFTGDRELAPIRNVLGGARLSYIGVGQDGESVWGLFDEVRFELKGDVLLLDELPANPEEDNPAGIGGQFLSSGQLIDAFVLQLALHTAF